MGMCWLQSMSVGVAEFDDDHQRVILLLDEVAAALARGDGGQAASLMAGLLALAEDHVAREEAFLRRIRFPNTDTVVAAQRDSLSRLAVLGRQLAAAPEAGRAVVTAMSEAFISYLLRADINYKSHVEACGAADR